MRRPRKILDLPMVVFTLFALVLFAVVVAHADDADDEAEAGGRQIRNISDTPDWETSHADLRILPVYVPAQTTQDELFTIPYVVDPEVADQVDESYFYLERDYARPLIATYVDGLVDSTPDSAAFYGHGQRDMFAAVSLDDGAKWKKTNLSRSARRSSIKIDGSPYPGDVIRPFTASDGNKVLVTWMSRFCAEGSPNYALTTSDEPSTLISALFDEASLADSSGFGADDAEACLDLPPEPDASWNPLEETLCPYFEDYFGVAGSQGVKDFADEGFPTVGEVPYACLWAARGTLELDSDTGFYEIRWRKAERLTSGRRDVHRIEAACDVGAGCVITWQEDPDGLRPGEGEGPGEGWSGAIAHHETDIWYSHLDWDNFDLVLLDPDEDPDTVTVDDIVTLADYDLSPDPSNRPPVAVPFSIPVRATDNAGCHAASIGENGPSIFDEAGSLADDPYCFLDFDQNGFADFCESAVAYTIETPEGPTQDIAMCVAEDGRLMRGNTGATRARTNLRAYDSDLDGLDDSGWVIFAYEESKGLGEEDDEDPDKVDMGKNIWYHTFDMFTPEFVSQGLMLNQPAIYPDDFELGTLVDYTLVPVDASAYTGHPGGGSFMMVEPDPVWGEIGLPTEPILYQTEIARRYSQITQTPADIKNSEEGTAGFLMFKQGIVRRGGPADVLVRRMVVDPDTFVEAGPEAENPFDYANMDCTNWLYRTDLGMPANPRYVKGLCLDTALNLSGSTIVTCVDKDGADVSCTVLDMPFDEMFADLDKSDDDGESSGALSLTLEWRQCGPGGIVPDLYTEGGTWETDYTDECSSTFDVLPGDLDDQTWENPYDLAKGHRGFMKGDYIVAMYAWAPNWEATNELGSEGYNLYLRRSFDGGATWTTTRPDFLPADSEAVADGSIHCEWYENVDGTDRPVCFDYEAGDYEQARNLSQFIGSHDTVLDPRYAPTPDTVTACMVDGVLTNPCSFELYPDDIEDQSKYFTTFEAGDTGPIADGGEGEPMDMYYARAINYGDEYDLVDVDGDGDGDGIPTVQDDEYVFDYFDALEWHKDVHAAEASLKANPGGTLFYAIYNAWSVDEDTGEDTDMDAVVRRTIEVGDDCLTLDSRGDGTGGGEGVIHADGFESGDTSAWSN